MGFFADQDMAEIICVIGNKGGTGKTTLSHMLCHGLALLDRRAACVMTDELREPLRAEGRRYVVADARSAKAREQMMAKLRNLPGWIGVLDGGANRTDTDIALYELSNLVLLPFRDSAEDLRTVIQDLERFPRAHALPSQWPHNRWQLEAADRLIATMPSHLKARVLPPVMAVSSSKLLLQTQLPDYFPTALNNSTRALANMILGMTEHKEQFSYKAVAPSLPETTAAATSATAPYQSTIRH
jgi:chromosome partitioning protein